MATERIRRVRPDSSHPVRLALFNPLVLDRREYLDLVTASARVGALQVEALADVGERVQEIRQRRILQRLQGAAQKRSTKAGCARRA